MDRRIAVSTMLSLFFASRLSAKEFETISPSTQSFLDFAAVLLRDQLPPSYENWKKWGKTKEIWAGLDVERKGLKIETRRKKKAVNHGAWSMYRIKQLTDAGPPEISLDNLRDAGGGVAAIDVLFRAKLNFFARHAQWEIGVQLWSLYLDADATVDLKMTCEASLKLDASKFPPDVTLLPRVTSAKLELDDFQINRVSKAGGPLIKSLSATLREIVEAEVEDRNQEILERINKQIAKNESKLRFSMADLAKSKWKEAEKFIPGGK